MGSTREHYMVFNGANINRVNRLTQGRGNSAPGRLREIENTPEFEMGGYRAQRLPFSFL